MKRFATVGVWCPDCYDQRRFRVQVPERQAHHALYQRRALGKGQCLRCEVSRGVRECKCPLCAEVEGGGFAVDTMPPRYVETPGA